MDETSTQAQVGTGFLVTAAFVHSTRGRDSALDVLSPGNGFAVGVAQGNLALRKLAGVLTRCQFWLFSLYLIPLGAIVIPLSFFRS